MGEVNSHMATEDEAQGAEDQGTPDGGPEDREGSEEQERAEANNRIERRNAELARELKQHKQRIAEFEKAEKERERLEAEKAGDFQKQLELAQKRAEEAEKQLASLSNERTERRILEAISESATAKPGLIKGAYLALLEEQKLDRYPDGDVEDAIKERTKALKKSFPDLFEPVDPPPKPRGGPPPREAVPTGPTPSVYRGP